MNRPLLMHLWVCSWLGHHWVPYVSGGSLCTRCEVWVAPGPHHARAP